MRVLVTGATGNVGRAVVEALRERGVEVREGRRSGDPPLDFTDERTFGPALDGVQGLFLLRPPAISRVGPTLNRLVDAGRAHLEHVVFLSVAGADRSRFIPHAAVERHLVGGPIPYTLLRAGFFGQNLLHAYREDIRDDDRLFLPAGDAKVAWVDTRDLGEAAAIAFVTPDARNVAWTLKGSESRSFAEVAELLSEHLGRSIRYQPTSALAYLWHLLVRRRLAVGQAVVQTVLHLALRAGTQSEPDGTLARVLGRPPRTIEDTIRDHLDRWRP